MRKIFEIETSFTFKGSFFIRAECKKEAMASIQNHCGLVLGGDIHTTLCGQDISWDFDTHPVLRRDKMRGLRRRNNAG